jgi:hypothetical protein
MPVRVCQRSARSPKPPPFLVVMVFAPRRIAVRMGRGRDDRRAMDVVDR